MIGKNVEPLKNMNASTSKFAKWYVRIIDPKVKDYTFQARGEKVNAKKFECVVVSRDPAQYMMGIVPFEFRNRQAADQAGAMFRPSSVWEVTAPAFDSKAKPDFIGCPLKCVLLLKAPTQLKEVTPDNDIAFKHPSFGLQVALDIKGIMEVLQRAGSATRSSKTFDFCGELVGLTDPKEVKKDQQALQVSEATFLDGGGGRVAVSVWQSATRALAGAQVGSGAAVVGCTATMDNGQVKLGIWPSAHVCSQGVQAEGLTGLDATTVAAETLTATFSPGQGLTDLLGGGAIPTCAVALGEAVAKGGRSHFRSIDACSIRR